MFKTLLIIKVQGGTRAKTACQGCGLRRRMNIEFNFPPKLRGARSRLYRRRFLQVNTRWKALAEIYTMHSFAPFSNLKIFVKNCWKFCCFFKQNFAKFVRNLLNFAKFLPIFFGIFPKCSIFLKIAGQFSEKLKNSKIWWNFHKFSQNSEIFRWKTVICRLHLDGLVC